jgi:hypothetical protein
MTRRPLRANNWAGLIGARRRSDNNAISRWTAVNLHCAAMHGLGARLVLRPGGR